MFDRASGRMPAMKNYSRLSPSHPPPQLQPSDMKGDDDGSLALSEFIPVYGIVL